MPAGRPQHLGQITPEKRVDRKIHADNLSEQVSGALGQIDELESDQAFPMVGDKRSRAAEARLTTMIEIQTAQLPGNSAKVAVGHEQRTFQGDIQKGALMRFSGHIQRALGMKWKTRKATAF